MQNISKFLILSILLFIINSKSSSQGGIQTNFTNNQITPSFFITDSISENFYLQHNFGTSFIINDKYNSEQFSASTFSLYTTLSLIPIELLLGKSDFSMLSSLLSDSSKTKETLGWIGDIIKMTLYLPNSQIYFYPLGYSPSTPRKMNISLFLRMQTNYFDYRTVRWFRFAPSIGIELTLFSFQKENDSFLRHYGFAFQFGLAQNWDLKSEKFIKGTLEGFLGLKTYFLIE